MNGEFKVEFSASFMAALKNVFGDVGAGSVTIPSDPPVEAQLWDVEMLCHIQAEAASKDNPELDSVLVMPVMGKKGGVYYVGCNNYLIMAYHSKQSTVSRPCVIHLEKGSFYWKTVMAYVGTATPVDCKSLLGAFTTRTLPNLYNIVTGVNYSTNGIPVTGLDLALLKAFHPSRTLLRGQEYKNLIKVAGNLRLGCLDSYRIIVQQTYGLFGLLTSLSNSYEPDVWAHIEDVTMGYCESTAPEETVGESGGDV